MNQNIQVNALCETIRKVYFQSLFKGKIIVLLGARHVGKTTLIRMLPTCASEATLWLAGENADVQQLLK